jgi:hypothetical protein
VCFLLCARQSIFSFFPLVPNSLFLKKILPTLKPSSTLYIQHVIQHVKIW